VRVSRVRPSHGTPQERLVCRTTIRVGALEREIELSLVCREGMLCRMLLGRTAIAGVALVDPGARHLLSSPHRRKGRGTP